MEKSSIYWNGKVIKSEYRMLNIKSCYTISKWNITNHSYKLLTTVNYVLTLHSEDNTWEPEENLDCPDLISTYEAQFQNIVTSSSDDNDKGTKRKSIAEDNRLRGFDRGLEPDKIVGATDVNGELMFLMMWKNCREADLVAARVANARCPEIVIKYYENKQMWYCKPNVIEIDWKIVISSSIMFICKWKFLRYWYSIWMLHLILIEIHFIASCKVGCLILLAFVSKIILLCNLDNLPS